MFLTIGQVLDSASVSSLRSELESLTFVDGRATAGWSARDVKLNRQAAPGPLLEELRKTVETALFANPTFVSAIRPKRFSPILFSKYQTGNRYGLHVDDAIMGGMRTDVAFTLFLSAPGDYEGGSLILDTPGGEEEIKPEAGSVFAYPATTLHRVEEVTAGERLVAVGWVRSLIRAAEQRELLFDLDLARRSLFAREGKSSEFDLLSKSHSNLLRMWAED